LTDPQSLIRDQESKISLYHGDFLQGLVVKHSPDFELWMLEEREKYRARAEALLQRVAETQLEDGEAGEVLETLTRLLRLDPWNEEAHRLKMQMLVRVGRQKEALAQYQQARKILRDDLDIEPARETTALYERLRDAKPLGVPLPPQPTEFFGRASERASLTLLLAKPNVRLITLFGPGGVGKTRLALAVAAEQAPRFLHGVIYVSLESVDSPRGVLPAVAAALGLALSSRGEPLTQLSEFVREKELLLVLDNFEPFIAAAPDLACLLQAAPDVKIILTSRTRLALQWEHLFEVGGLPYARDLKGQDLGRLDAIRLFTERARRMLPDLEPSEEDMGAIARICRTVEGVPLAIELAAGLVRTQSFQGIAAQLEDDFTRLESSLRDRSERQRSLRAVFEQSWHALSQLERELLKRLAVFRGGMNFDAARVITGASHEQLAALTDKAFLHRVSDERWEMHAVIHEFARAALDASPLEAENTGKEHAKYFSEFLSARRTRIVGGTQLEALREIRVDFENVRAAWLRAVAQGDTEQVERAAPVLYRYLEAQSSFQEAERLTEPAAEISRVARARLGAVWYFLGKLDASRAQLEMALEQARGVNDHGEEAFCLLELGNVAFDLAEYGLAETYYLECLRLARAVQDYYLMCDSEGNLAVVTIQRGQVEQSRIYCEGCIAAATQIDEKRGIAAGELNLSEVFYAQGKYPEARAALERALPHFEAAGDRRGVTMTLGNLGALAQQEGRLADAEHFFQQSLKGYQELGLPEKIAEQSRNLGDVALQRGQHLHAQEWYQDSYKIYHRHGARYGESHALKNLGDVALAAGEVGRAEEYYHQALRLAQEVQALPRVLDALLGSARVCADRGDIVWAVTLGLFVADHPAAEHATRVDASKFLSTAQSRLTPEWYALAKERAAKLTVEEASLNLIHL
jgi:tetratricopeptide (TPR) repeat protein